MERRGYHLSVPVFTHRDQSAYPSASNEPFSSTDLCGISACKVYPPAQLPVQAVSSYLTFSPFHLLFPSPRSGEGPGDEVIFCGTICSLSGPGSSPVHCPLLSRLSSFLPLPESDNPVCSYANLLLNNQKKDKEFKPVIRRKRVLLLNLFIQTDPVSSILM